MRLARTGLRPGELLARAIRVRRWWAHWAVYRRMLCAGVGFHPSGVMMPCPGIYRTPYGMARLEAFPVPRVVCDCGNEHTSRLALRIAENAVERGLWVPEVEA